MECLDRITIPNPKYYYRRKDGGYIKIRPVPDGETDNISVPCGRCYVCLSARREQWAFRLAAESNYSTYTVFVTLTLDPQFIGDGKVHKEVLQKYFKRLRKDGLKFRYYAIGEYGTQYARPHYHCMFFIKNEIGTKTDYQNIMLQNWPFGFVTFGDITPARVNYVLHYHVRSKVVNGKSTFAVCSQALGLEFITPAMLEYMRKSENYFLRDVSGFGAILPRYYRKKFALPPKMVDKQCEFDADVSNMMLYLADVRKYYEKKLNDYELQNKF